MTTEYLIHGHGSVQDPFGRLFPPFHAGKSTITFFANYGSCAIVNRNKLSIASGMHNDNNIHYIKRKSNLTPRLIESRIGIPLFTQNGWVPDLWIDTSPSNLAMAGIYQVKPDGSLQTVHSTRHRKEFMLLSNIVHQHGPAHFHVLTCRAAADTIHHNDANILRFALNKNRDSTSRRKIPHKSELNANIPVSLEKLKTRGMHHFKRLGTGSARSGSRPMRLSKSI